MCLGVNNQLQHLYLYQHVIIIFVSSSLYHHYYYFQPREFRLNMNMTDGLNTTRPYLKCLENNDFSFCYPVYSYIVDAIAEQFWTIFGYGWAVEPPAATLIPSEKNVST